MVGGGQNTVAPASITYASVVSHKLVRISPTVAAMNDLDILACDIQNAYLTSKCRDKIWTISGPEFNAKEEVTQTIVTMELYRLKLSGA